MIEISGWRKNNIKLEFFSSIVFAEPELVVLWIIFDIDYIVYCELEGFECRVEVFGGMRPAVPV